MTDSKEINFEQSLQALESLVRRMETGNMALEDSLQAFEQGVSLVKECQQALNDAEQRVKVLTRVDGQEQLRDFKESE